MLELLLLVFVFALLVWHRKLSTRLQALELTVAELRGRLEDVPVAAAAAAEPRDATEALDGTLAQTPAGGTEAGALGPGDGPSAEPALDDPAKPQAADEPPLPEQRAARESFESRFGARWSVWVGGLALALGGIFLVRYSIDAGLLGPAARLTLAALFGIVLASCGEILRRGAMPRLPKAYSGAMIPGILTAAASVTLMATIFTAYGVYGFIGPTTAFLGLAGIALATLLLSLLHGQGLAGLGLAASLLTPALVATDAPDIAFLFGYLSLVWLAAAAAARIRRWHVLPVLANIGLTLWVIAYAVNTPFLDPVPPGVALMVLVAGTAFLWPGRAFETAEGTRLETVPLDPTKAPSAEDLVQAAGTSADLPSEPPSEPPAEPSAAAPSGWRRLRSLLTRRPRAIVWSASACVFFGLLCLVVLATPGPTHPVMMLTAVTGTLAALGAGRRAGAIPAVTSAVTAILGIGIILLIQPIALSTPPVSEAGSGSFLAVSPSVLGALTLGAIFTVCGLIFLRRKGPEDPDLAALWALLAALVPVTLAALTFLTEGKLGRDWLHGLYGLAIGSALILSVELASRKGRLPALAGDLLIAGSFAAFTFSLHALTHGLTTTLAVAALGFAYVLAASIRSWRGLPFAMVLAAVVVGARIAWEPTIVGPEALAKTPVFNALLAGYGIPAALLILSCWLLRHWPGRRALNALQGLAALSGLLTLSILVRHAMNGGVLTEHVPTLGEQSIHTLLLVGASGLLMTLDLKSPSMTFRYGSMLAGVIATINILFVHLFMLNPFFTNEPIGTWPLVNLLLPGYLLPALGFAGLALYARDKRPQLYVVMLALSGAVLAFAWATLSVRWFWHGSMIGDWKGFLQGETYTYSVVWLLIGVGLLALGSRLDARTLRLASAGLVLISVCKVFLIDMSNLEGILRALSFIGLGGVLIGIGMFYQRILARSNRVSPPAGDTA
ncbi:DUF2339 domain-containing protein [Rhizobium sp. SSA_523]|uniref:DUF2339 domain-containing protein n=1 Tax=Rhizobium sp. SSA_523 TaxID=2952477 RepID=UPI002090F4C4|nr:DUF2339 domain-containing protein [Rhizobium sp. SSA_523]MCO5730822.1 DUF2339 domain-containing protein [Rhizobium sp. SSA_523]WKC24356.1 DUF2339 domain-containing protein [Rhizobium sp. SSA_523]